MNRQLTFRMAEKCFENKLRKNKKKSDSLLKHNTAFVVFRHYGWHISVCIIKTSLAMIKTYQEQGSNSDTLQMRPLYTECIVINLSIRLDLALLSDTTYWQKASWIPYGQLEESWLIECLPYVNLHHCSRFTKI